MMNGLSRAVVDPQGAASFGENRRRAGITGGTLPVQALAAWNLAIGFVLIIAGVALSTKWR